MDDLLLLLLVIHSHVVGYLVCRGQAIAWSSIMGYNVAPCIQLGIQTLSKSLGLTTMDHIFYVRSPATKGGKVTYVQYWT